MAAYLNSIGTAVPSLSLEQSQISELLKHHYSEELSSRSLDVLEKVLLHPGIKKRHFAAENLRELEEIRNEHPDIRASRFQKWVVSLSAEALKKAASKADVDIKSIDAIITNTCTGYLCPGISSYLIEELGLDNSVRVYDLAGMGCGGAIPNLQLASSLVQAENITVAGIAVEICSATFQMGNDMSLLISNALFGDGAAAFIVSPERSGFEILSSCSGIFPQYREAVRYVYKNGQLHNKLSPGLPQILSSLLPSFVKDLLSGTAISEINNWAIHPGGEKILNSVQSSLSLTESKIGTSRNILKEYGNMSSPSVMFAIDKIMENISSGESVCVLGFGAGLSVHGTLLKSV
jgi:predicted naringenin-chalcone synthase